MTKKESHFQQSLDCMQGKFHAIYKMKRLWKDQIQVPTLTKVFS